MVRRIASRNLGSLIYTVAKTIGPSSIAENGPISTILLDLLELLAGGDQPDSVRLHTTENCVCFGNAMAALKERDDDTSIQGANDEFITTRINALVKCILPLIIATIDDRSWRVRWTAASRFAAVVKVFSTLSGTMDALVPAYEKLLQDPEAEVRTSAALNLAEVAKTGSKVYPVGWNEDGMDCSEDDGENRITIAERLVQRVMALTEDDSENVRAALAMVATELAPLLGRDVTITHLLPPMLLLLRDSTSEVRLNIISSLSLLNDVIGEELLSQSLLPAILDLAEDGKWRIRIAVIDRMPLLAKQFGKDFFNDKLLELCVGWLGDDISSIREAAAKNLKELTALLGSEWSVQHLLPRVKAVMENPSYLRRMNAVQGIVHMATAMDVNTAQLEALPILLEMACDTVPNVRFNVAKGLRVVGPLFSRYVYESQIVPILTLLNDDPDRDVRYFANQTSDSLRDVFEKDS
jgi:serine/threonine-protein phosphatase 2A regulatory subunit A